VTQEALTNVRKHAPGARATVLVRYEPSVVSVEVTNTRTAAPTNGHQAGHGLVGMRERVSFFGGDFSTGPTSDGGYSVRATFPTPPAAD
jgi:signal transduction histidine kinase